MESHEPAANRLESPLPPRVADAGHEGGFSLASLLMFVTLVSVVLGVSSIAPGVGMPLAVIALITWARTVSVVRWRGSIGGMVASAILVVAMAVIVGVPVVVVGWRTADRLIEDWAGHVKMIGEAFSLEALVNTGIYAVLIGVLATVAALPAAS